MTKATLEGSEHSCSEPQQCAPGVTVQQHLPGTIAELSGDLCILPEAGKSFLCVSSSVTPKKGNCRQVKKKQVKRTDELETLWGENKLWNV